MTENYLTILAETIRTNWDAPALTDFYLTEDGTAQDTSRGNHYTYGEMYTEVCRVADLLTALGLQKGDHIAICGANSAHWVIAYLAIAKMQGVSVTVMHSLMPDEIANLVAFSDAKALFTDQDLWSELSPMYQPSLGDVSFVLSLADWTLLSCDQSADNYDTYTIDTRKIHERYTLHSDTITEGTQEEPNPLAHRPSLGDSPSMHRPYMGDTNSPSLRKLISFPSSAPDDLAMICFTSGTSGSAKGVMLSYGNISACVEVVGSAYPANQNFNALTLLPLSHSFSLGYTLVAILDNANVHFSPESIDPQNLILYLEIIKPYAISIVPQVLSLFMSTCNHIDYSFLEYIVVGGASVSFEMIRELRELGLPITMGYGLSEAAASISMVSPLSYKLYSCGKIVSTLSVRISPAGEILVKGENVMLGYYKDPEATAAKIDSDGWLHTGDKGHLDEDGYLYVEGRLEQDIIVLPNGENIRPDNIEALINALPEVSESIVFARNGHLVAIVVPANSSPKLGEVSQRDGGVCIENTPAYLRRKILRDVNPQLPDFSQLYDVEITDTPLQRTEKQTIKRYLYK